jgi:hypothetical protein
MTHCETNLYYLYEYFINHEDIEDLKWDNYIMNFDDNKSLFN